MLIVIDGPAGSGKSSVSKIIADKLNINYLDTGSMYRMITYYFLKNNLSLDEASIINYIDEINMSYTNNKLLLNNEDVEQFIRSNEINSNIGSIANSKTVREKMIELQRSIVENNDFIVDGRDLGTVVFPNCKNKFYLTASVDTRAKRRFEQNKRLGIDSDLDQIKASIKQRDKNDMNREISPLKQADDAILIDSSDLSLEEVVNKIISLV